MIEDLANSRNHEHSQEEDAHSSKERPIYKTEITLEVNNPYDSCYENEDLSVHAENHKRIINRAAYSKLHKAPVSSKTRLNIISTNGHNNTDAFCERNAFKSHVSNHRNQVDLNSPMTNGAEDELEFIQCVVRSESVDTIDEIEKELSKFVMDNRKKDKKRSNSFRKLFSVPFFGKDKKKKTKESSETYPTNSDYKDNYHNEVNCNSFMRNTPQRHTVSCDHLKSRKNISSKKNDFPASNEEPPPEILRKYASNHIDRFNRIRRSFESSDHSRFTNVNNDNVCQNSNTTSSMKYIDTSSSSTVASEKLSTYQNALIAQAEMRNAEQTRRPSFADVPRTFKNNSLRRDTPPRAQDTLQPVNIVKPRARLPINSGRPLPNPYKNSEGNTAGILNDLTPKGVEDQISEVSRPELSDIYGTVFDAVTRNSSNFSTLSSRKSAELTSSLPKSPRSPSLEMSKLKLPSNREIIPLQPRVQSPLPFTKVSSEKIIATELLKKSNVENEDSRFKRNSLSSPPSSQNNTLISPFAESTPENKSVSEEIGALRNKLEENDQNLKHELDQIKTTLEKLSFNDVRSFTERATSDIDGSVEQVHSPRRFLPPDATQEASRTLIPNAVGEWKPKSPQNVILDSPTGTGGTTYSHREITQSPRDTLPASSRSSITMSPHTVMSETTSASPKQQIESQQIIGVELRQKTQSDRKTGSNSSPSSPSKDEIRRSVEAYYWKEIKKIKEKEDYDIYMSHLHYSHAGYAEDPVGVRRSRGMEDTRSRRSLSVPRNARQHLSFENSNVQRIPSHAAPRGNFVIYGSQPNDIYGYANRLNAQTSEYREKNGNFSNSKEHSGDYGTYKPIFRRGSLTGGVYQPTQKNKSVSFSNSQQLQNSEAWPTKNGFTNSPPQRRLAKANNNTIDDDVFLPSQVQHQINAQYQPIYGRKQTPLYRINPNSDAESLYGRVQQPDIYAHQGVHKNMQRNANYSSDSEALYGRVRRYKTLGQQELENLRNAQLRGMRPILVSPNPSQGLTRHESIQLPEPTYGYAAYYGSDRRGSYQTPSSYRNMYFSNHRNPTRRDILITDDIYGQHIGFKNDSNRSLYGYSSRDGNTSESPYGNRPKHVTVRNKVCDIYGRIHDMDPNSSEIQSMGVLMGQLSDSPSSPTNFRRNTRLTSSSNDIQARRVGVHQNFNIERVNQVTNNIIKGAPARPLPPLPPSGKMAKKNAPKKKKK